MHLAVGVWNDARHKLRGGAWEHCNAVAGHGFGKGGPSLCKLGTGEPWEELVLA